MPVSLSRSSSGPSDGGAGLDLALGLASTRASVLELPLEDRRELAMSLLWSLPREDVIAINDNISRMLQKDIVGSLPPEIGINILSRLSLTDVLSSRLVSTRWAKLCTAQSLWTCLCLAHTPPIRARHTTWADIASHQQLLHYTTDPSSLDADEGAFESGLDELSLQPDVGGVDLSPAHHTSATDPMSMSMQGGMRGLVWERSGSGLPTHATPPSRRRPRRSSVHAGKIDCPIESHASTPSVLPRVNHMHLVIAHAILARRMWTGQGMPLAQPSTLVSGRTPRIPQAIRPRMIDAISSIDAGGLPGHAETVYSLQLIARQMDINLGPACAECHAEARPRSAVESLSTGFSTPRRHAHVHHGRSSPARAGQPLVASGRDWLMSSSRDHTLRLWQLSCPRPKVVKIFHDGHIGSVLCHVVVEVPVRDPNSSPTSTHSGRYRRRGSARPARTRLVAVSGGSDGRLCLWDVEHGDGRPERVQEAHDDSVLCVRADDERVVTSSKDRTIRVFDVCTLEELLVIDCNTQEGHRGAINSVCLTKDYIISASGDRSIRVWCIHTGLPLTSLEATTRGIASMDYSPPPLHAHPSLKGIILVGSSDASITVLHLVSHVPARRGVDIVDALDMIPPMRDLTFSEMLEHEDADEAGVGPDGARRGSVDTRSSSIRGTAGLGRALGGLGGWEQPERDADASLSPSANTPLADFERELRATAGAYGSGSGSGYGNGYGYGYDEAASFYSAAQPEAPELRLEPAGQCWAPCSCPLGMGRGGGGGGGASGPAGRPAGAASMIMTMTSVTTLTATPGAAMGTGTGAGAGARGDIALCGRCNNQGHTDLVRSVCLGEKVILSGSYDSTVKIWDRASGQLLANLTGVHSGRIFSVVGDRMRIVSSGLDSRISIWDFSEGIDTAFVEP